MHSLQRHSCGTLYEQLLLHGCLHANNFSKKLEISAIILVHMTMEGESYHKQCFTEGTHSSYAALNSVLYCRHHFAQLFLEKGTFSHVLKAADRNKNIIPDQDTTEVENHVPDLDTEVESKPDTTKEADEEQES
ncbi:hypothetical protein L1987_25580 [Smallanthus sonchifolius]|uniref:Uncharacterized protein n=1 Tax=Smallanthus sonchifolius TaxID=185202 RepID=A0ACB9I9P8_9ASTR|nr:hypothetical protein L1987_25580 [Smallanthus sonchifolius]